MLTIDRDLLCQRLSYMHLPTTYSDAWKEAPLSSFSLTIIVALCNITLGMDRGNYKSTTEY